MSLALATRGRLCPSGSLSMATRGRLCSAAAVLAPIFIKLIATVSQVSVEASVTMAETLADVAQQYTEATVRQEEITAAVASAYLVGKAKDC